MAYKRTSKKTGVGSRRTTTVNNSNSSITNSVSNGSKNFRTTYTSNSKTGSKITQTWRDGAGFVHTKTISRNSTPTEAQRRREARRAQQFWRNLLFGTKKRQRRRGPRNTSSTVTPGFWILAALALLYLVSR
jgi:hypothetical protein